MTEEEKFLTVPGNLTDTAVALGLNLSQVNLIG